MEGRIVDRQGERPVQLGDAPAQRLRHGQIDLVELAQVGIDAARQELELAEQPVVAQLPKLDSALDVLQAYLKRREAAELMPDAQAEPALEPDIEAIEEDGQ